MKSLSSVVRWVGFNVPLVLSNRTSNLARRAGPGGSMRGVICTTVRWPESSNNNFRSGTKVDQDDLSLSGFTSAKAAAWGSAASVTTGTTDSGCGGVATTRPRLMSLGGPANDVCDETCGVIGGRSLLERS
ncbi:MAG TPA: hypothetical protein VGQ87_03055 [Patescibacteria group bacterium]|nr:hypothetical protein [Patescibacteria group bacterium]